LSLWLPSYINPKKQLKRKEVLLFRIFSRFAVKKAKGESLEKRLKILAVCGMGVGTSMLLKMQVDKAIKVLDINAVVDIADISTARGLAVSADLIITSNELADRIGDVKAPIISVSNFMDLEAIIEGIRSKLNLNN
jgi:PTS system ascorbate-specific IIB component